jgi:hypothetical protein
MVSLIAVNAEWWNAATRYQYIFSDIRSFDVKVEDLER